MHDMIHGIGDRGFVFVERKFGLSYGYKGEQRNQYLEYDFHGLKFYADDGCSKTCKGCDGCGPVQ
jgi:hypothetical protein